jgi:hypothetical protein
VGYPIEQGNTTEPLVFVMTLLGGVTPAVGISPNVYLSKNGFPFAAPVGAVTEVGGGLYKVAPHPSDADTIGSLLLLATAVGCENTQETYDVEAAAVVTPPLPGDSISISALGLIRMALMTIGRLGAGEAVQAEAAQDCYTVLNEMLDNWKTQRLLIPQLTRIEFDLQVGKTDYTIGPGGDIDIDRPYSIRYAFVLDANNPGLERSIGVYNEDDLANRSYKTFESPIVNNVYYTPTYPLGTVTVPASSSASTLALYVLTGLPRFNALSDEYILLPGYAKAIRYNLAIQVAPLFGVQPSGFVYQEGKESIGDVKRINQRHRVLGNYFTQSGGHYNVYSDETAR